MKSSPSCTAPAPQEDTETPISKGGGAKSDARCAPEALKDHEITIVVKA